MTWHETCDDFDSRIEASAQDASFNDTIFLLTQMDAGHDDKVFVNKAILALISPVFYAQFYGPLATRNDGPIEIVDGTARGFKQLINFICNPKSFQFQVQNVAEIFDISYFAHKYQIGSLVSRCRQFLVVYPGLDDVVDDLNWAVSSERGLELKETFPAEHSLLVHNCWEWIERWFGLIFQNGALKDDQDLPDEDVMMEILGRSGIVEEEFALSIAMDYYCKLMDKRQKSVQNQKRIKIDDEAEWNQNIANIKKVVQFERVRPKKLSEIYKKFFHKIPVIVGKITQEISASWKDKDNFPSSQQTERDRLFEIPFSFIDSENTGDWIHDDKREVQIKFKTNRNAVLHLAEDNLIPCPCSDSYCCLDGSIKFQNEDYKEEVIFGEDLYFYVKENKEAILTYKTKCSVHRESCDFHLVRMNQFQLSRENFQVDILEVNGKPVTSPCYTFIENLFFTPL